MRDFHSINEALHMESVARTDQLITEQLSNLAQKGLLVFEHGPSAIYEKPGTTMTEYGPAPSFGIERTITFHLKDKEYIKDLENKIKQLEIKVATLKEQIIDLFSKKEKDGK